MLGDGKSVSWGGAQTKGEGRECELTKSMFFYNDSLQLCLREERDLPFFPQTQLQRIIVEEHTFGEFALSTLTFGLCTSPTDTFTVT